MRIRIFSVFCFLSKLDLLLKNNTWLPGILLTIYSTYLLPLSSSSSGDPGDVHGRGHPGTLGLVDAALRRQGQESGQRLAEHPEVQPGADVWSKRRGLQVGPHEPRDPPNDGHGHAPLRLRFLGVQAADGGNAGHRVGLRGVFPCVTASKPAEMRGGVVPCGVGICGVLKLGKKKNAESSCVSCVGFEMC